MPSYSEMHTVASYVDGRILAGGSFSGSQYQNLLRLYTSGLGLRIDTAFKPNVNNTVYAAVVLNDDSALIGGSFSSITKSPAAAVYRNGLAQLLPSGEVATNFNANFGAGSIIYAILLLEDGRFLVGGSFTNVAGRPIHNLVQLNPDGSLDPQFHPGEGPNDAVLALAVQPDGKILIGGDFTQVDGVPGLRLALLLPNGALDTSFDTRAGANGPIQALLILPDESLVVGGDFTRIEGMARTGLARFVRKPLIAAPQLLYPHYANGRFEVEVQTINHVNYVLEYKNSLFEGSWVHAQKVLGSGSTERFADTNAVAGEKYYRARIE
jgi:uncharacterized delta-60 repeat protein